jgi:hypothetical protein
MAGFTEYQRGVSAMSKVWPPPIKRRPDERPTNVVKRSRYDDNGGVRALQLHGAGWVFYLLGLLFGYPLFIIGFGLGACGFVLGVIRIRSTAGKVAVALPLLIIGLFIIYAYCTPGWPNL